MLGNDDCCYRQLPISSSNHTHRRFEITRILPPPSVCTLLGSCQRQVISVKYGHELIEFTDVRVILLCEYSTPVHSQSNESQRRARRLPPLQWRHTVTTYSDVLSVNKGTRAASQHRCRYNKLLFTAELRLHVLFLSLALS